MGIQESITGKKTEAEKKEEAEMAEMAESAEGAKILMAKNLAKLS